MTAIVRCDDCQQDVLFGVFHECQPTKAALTLIIKDLLEVIDRELEKSGCDRGDLPMSSQAKIKAATEALD